MTLVKNTESNNYHTVNTPFNHPYMQDMMQTVYKNGEILKEYSLEEVRKNAERI